MNQDTIEAVRISMLYTQECIDEDDYDHSDEDVEMLEKTHSVLSELEERARDRGSELVIDTIATTKSDLDTFTDGDCTSAEDLASNLGDIFMALVTVYLAREYGSDQERDRGYY